MLVPTSRGVARRVGDSWQMLGRREGLPGRRGALRPRGSRGLAVGGGRRGAGPALGRGTSRAGAWPTALSHELGVVDRARPRGDATVWVGTQEGLNRLTCRPARPARAGTSATASAAISSTRSRPRPTAACGPAPGPAASPALPAMAVARRYAPRAWRPASSRSSRSTCAPTATCGPGGAGRSGSRQARPGSSRRGSRADPRATACTRSRRTGTASCSRSAAAGPAAHRRAPAAFTKADGLKDDFVASIVRLADDTFVIGYREALGAARAPRARRPAGARAHRTRGRAVVRHGPVRRADSADQLWVAATAAWRSAADGGRRRPLRPRGRPTHRRHEPERLLRGRGWRRLGGDQPGLVRYGPASRWATGRRPTWCSRRSNALACWPRASSRRWPATSARSRSRGRASTFRDPSCAAIAAGGGLEDEFVETAQTGARYPGLAAGRYRFEVVAVGADGWSPPHPRRSRSP